MGEKKGEELFLRKATGLVRAWSFFDIFVFNSDSNPYSFLPISFFIAYVAFWPEANLLYSSILFTIIFATFQLLVYSMLASTMPRAGGDYIWICRILPWPIIGYVLPLITWVVVLALWYPLFGVSMIPFLQAISVALGNIYLALWWSTPNGIFSSTMLLIALSVMSVLIGMRWAGRLLRGTFILGGVIAVIATIIISLAYTQSHFVSAYNSFYLENFGIENAYQAVVHEGTEVWGYSFLDFWDWRFFPAMWMWPLVAFYNLWSMWGAPMYGEVRGASEMKVSFWSMQGSSLFNNSLLFALILAWVSLTGYTFFQSSNLLYGSFLWYSWNPAAAGLLYEGTKVWPMLWPSPLLFIHMLTKNAPLTLLIATFGFIYGLILQAIIMVYCTIRVLFAMAFDRMMPSPLASLVTKYKIPIVTLIAYVILALIQSAVYFYMPGMVAPITFHGTAMLALTFAVAGICAAILPWRLPKVWKASAASKYKIGPIPLITVAGIGSFAMFVWLFYVWLVDVAYGMVVKPWVPHPAGLVYFAVIGLGSIAFYLFMKWYRKRQGIDVSLIYKEIPVE